MYQLEITKFPSILSLHQASIFILFGLGTSLCEIFLISFTSPIKIQTLYNRMKFDEIFDEICQKHQVKKHFTYLALTNMLQTGDGIKYGTSWTSKIFVQTIYVNHICLKLIRFIQQIRYFTPPLMRNYKINFRKLKLRFRKHESQMVFLISNLDLRLDRKPIINNDLFVSRIYVNHRDDLFSDPWNVEKDEI